jgi:lysophospholipase L1-like esterase
MIWRLLLVGMVGVPLFAIIGLHSYSAACYHDALYPNLTYLTLDFLYAALGLGLFACAFAIARGEQTVLRQIVSRTMLMLAMTALLLSMADVYIVLFRFDTSGPGGVTCLTHRNWHTTYVYPNTNELGYWERSLAPFLREPKRSDRLVVAAVGDSFTWGQGVLGQQHRFTDVLQRELQAESDVSVEVLNFGAAGADTTAETRALDDVARVKPDVVLLCYLTNDIDHYIRFEAPRAARGSSFERRLTLGSPLANYLYWKLRAPWAYREFSKAYMGALYHAYEDKGTMKRHLDDVDAMIRKVKEIGATPVLVILPFPAMWADEGFVSEGREQSDVRCLRDRVYAAVAGRARHLGAALIEVQSLETEMSVREFSVSSMDAHPSIAAHQKIAQALREGLVEQRVLDRGGQPVITSRRTSP